MADDNGDVPISKLNHDGPACLLAAGWTVEGLVLYAPDCPTKDQSDASRFLTREWGYVYVKRDVRVMPTDTTIRPVRLLRAVTRGHVERIKEGSDDE